MDRSEFASFLYTAERTSTMHAALAVLLGLNGLRVSEACGANIDDLGFPELTEAHVRAALKFAARRERRLAESA